MTNSRVLCALLLVAAGQVACLDPNACYESDKTKCCSDKKQNDAETDVDCGGGICGGCADSKVCVEGSDCASGVCTAEKCAAPTCTDKVKNGTEVDADCGGSCGKCAAGKHCTGDTDCASSVCASGTCAAPSCDDGKKNGDEIDADCGGSCELCGRDQNCDGDSSNCKPAYYCEVNDSVCKTRLNCPGVVTCVNTCEDQTCLMDCIDAGTDSGSSKFTALYQCIGTNCQTQCTSDQTACNACIQASCSAEYTACASDR